MWCWIKHNINKSSVCSKVLNCNIIIMSVLNFARLFCNYFPILNLYFSIQTLKIKKIKRRIFHSWWQESCLKLVYILSCLLSIAVHLLSGSVHVYYCYLFEADASIVVISLMRYESQSSGVTFHHPPLSAVYHTQTHHDITVLCVAVIICCFFHISKLLCHSS